MSINPINNNQSSGFSIDHSREMNEESFVSSSVCNVLQTPGRLLRYFLTHPVPLLFLASVMHPTAANAAWPSNQDCDASAVAQLPVVVGLFTHPLPDNYPRSYIFKNPNEKKDGEDNDQNNCVDDIYGCHFMQKNGKFIGYNGRNFPPIDDANSFHSWVMASLIVKNPDLDIKVLPLSADFDDGLKYPFKPMLEYAKTMNCSIVVAPHGVTFPPLDEEIPFERIDKLVSKDCKEGMQGIEEYNGLLIFSAGNDGVDTDRMYRFPVSHSFRNPNLLAVGQVDEKGRMTPISNYGSHVTLAVRTINKKFVGPCFASPKHKCLLNSNPKEDFRTSGASGIVGHVAGRIKQINPLLTPAEIKQILLTSGDTPPRPAKGYVILNEEKALQKARETLQSN